MGSYYLAIDIGASSGRHILGHLENGRMVLEEVYRFQNAMASNDGELTWDVDRLFSEIIQGMKQCKKLHKIPVSVGIDTWGVDFVLLDKESKRIGNVTAYRDNRTKGMDQEVYQHISEQKLYEETGVQKQMFNTIYQLMAIKKRQPEKLERAEKLLMIPDYFHFLLTGEAASEYTNTTTTQLVSPITKDWDWQLIKKLGYPEHIFQKIVRPGTRLGTLKPEIRQQIGYDCSVVLPATHDTGSAVMAVPSNQENTLYISSGTWSLMGTELLKADCTVKSQEHNLTNEGGYDYRFRYLKNIMGLWMIQSVKKEIGKSYSFDDICKLAAKSTIDSIVDCNDSRFMAPENMTKEVQRACEESGQEVPRDLAEVAAVIYHSLAACYATTIAEIEELCGKKFDRIHIVGGGANASYLNRLTAEATGRNVYAGPTEATAVGNLAAQMIADEEMTSLWDARKCIHESFPITIFETVKQ